MSDLAEKYATFMRSCNDELAAVPTNVIFGVFDLLCENDLADVIGMGPNVARLVECAAMAALATVLEQRRLAKPEGGPQP